MTYQKSSSFVLICAFISACVTMAGGAPNNPLAQAARVVERGENHRIWEQVHAITNDVKGAAQVQLLTNRYTELGAGLSYRQRDGSWADSHAELTLAADGGAEARKLPHKVHFAPDINTVAAVRMTLPDGKLMSSTPRGLYLYDSSSKERLIVGVITNSTGVIVPPNLVVYSNCFVGFDADLILRVTPAGLEQDIAIRESLDWIPLAELGFDPKSTVLEAWTEFYAAPKPAKKKNSIRARRVKGAEAAELSDEKLDFGSVIMRPGRAYSTRDAKPQVGLAGHGNEPGSIPVGKVWLDAEDSRRFLIESVRWPELLPHFEGLQKGSAITNAAFRPDMRSSPSAIPEIPPALMAQVSSDRMLVAQHASASVPAFILDYATVNGYYPSYVFAPDQTYYISGGVYIDNAVFYGGSVIKLASMGTYAGIYIANSARFETGPGRMVLFTGKDDNSVGEWISGSSGNPLADFYGNPALSFEYDAQSVDMKYVRFSHTGQAVQFYNALRENRVRHCQFVRALYGILSAENSLTLHNVLLNDVDTYFAGYSFSAYGEHVTIHGGWIVGDDWGDASLTLVNSLIVGPDLGWMSINLPSPSVAISPEPAQPVFQTMGFGAHYLAANSPYRGIGNPNINLELREALKQKTTYPPVGLPGGSLVNVTLAPHVLRNDGAQPDLGYSYDVLDYQGGGLYMQSGSTLLLTNGVSVSLNAGAISWGIRLMSGTKLISEGTPVKPNRLVEMRSIQEQYGGWVYPGFSSIYCEYAPGAYPQIQLRFTELLGRAGLNWHIYRNGGLTSISLRDSEIFGGGITGLFTDTGVHNVDLINNLFEWSKIIIEANGGTRLSVEHNTFTNGQIRFIGQNSSNSRFRDNIVDKVNVSVSPLFAITGNGYYVTPALPGSPPQHTLISPVNYQQGPLGDFYLPSGSSPLLSGGSQTPSASGLFHYTARVSQEKEGSKPDPMVNGRVDVGYHYVAVSSPNVALGKVATQSTTDFGGPASRAVDGNTDGNWGSASVSHTAYEEEPWWQVDLGAVTSISDVRIWNRTDCCGERLSNFHVFVSDNPFQYTDVSSTLTQPGVSSYYVSGPAGTLAVLTIARTARYVRVQLTGADYLSLAEVQVFAPYSPIDSDNDGLADYVEDRNGNGIVDAGESSPYNPDTDNDCMPDLWEVTHGTNPSIADTNADPDGDVLNNLAEYLAGTHPNIQDIGYIPNNKNGQPWPATVPIPAPQLGAPTQEREYKFQVAGLSSVRPNDGLARALGERIDSVLRTAVAAPNRANWVAYAALQPFTPGGDVHNITDPINTANYTLEEPIPTHTAFMDIYFETADNLCYTYDAEARLRRRRPNTERWYNWIKNGAAPTTGAAGFAEQEGLNNRIEFMSKVDRVYDPINRPGWSEVTESRNRDVVPWFSALNVQGRLNDYQDGRWPADLQLRRQVWTDPIVPSGDLGEVCNAAWKLREYFVKKLDVPFDFGCPATYAGSYSEAIAVGDFNGDGRPDVAMAIWGSNVRIYLCNADGTFTPGGTFAVNGLLDGICVADFNQDTRLDLVVTDFWDNPGKISVLMGNGNGTFAAPVNYNLGPERNKVAAGKFNAGAYPDLVVPNFDDDLVSVLLNNGNGTFAAKVDYSAVGGPYGVAVADFNGDQLDDIAVALVVGNSVGVLLANANGTFGTMVSYAAGSGSHGVSTGDFNGDNRVDLAVANRTGGNVSVLLGNGNGTFAAAVNYSIGTLPAELAVADYNRDGKLDIAATIDGGNMSLLKGNGNGTFAAAVNFDVGAQAPTLATADFNSDGFPDLAVAVDSSLKILLNEAGSDIFKLRPKVVIFQERRRQHFRLQGLRLSFVPGVILENTFIITVDAVYVYEQDKMLAFMKQEPGSTLPQPLGSFVEVEVEFERDTSDTLDDMINVQPPRPDKALLEALRTAFFQDQDKVISLIKAEFNDKPRDLTEFYTIKAGDQLLVDMSTHAQVTETVQTGVQMGVAGQVGTGLAFDGNGYVSYVAQAQSAAPVATVEANPTFVLTEFQSRGTPYAVNGDDNRDAIQDENGARNDWIEIQNVTASVQSLSGWSVRDSQVTYTIPAGISVPPGGFVIVFADDGNAGLHANFRITGGGEYLALQRPNGLGGWIIATEYNVPAIPNFEYDISYGIVPNGSGWTEGFLHANPGEPNEGIYQLVPMNLGTADFTISLWLKTSAQNVAILSKGDNDGTVETGEKQLYLSTGKVRYFGQGQSGIIAGNTAVNNNVWRHIAITFAGGVGKVYVDGADDTAVANYTPIADAASAGLLLGFAAGKVNFNGVLDDVAIWNRALPLTEIQAIRNAGLNGSSVNTRAHIPGGLLFHASMDVSLQPEAATKYRQAVDLLP